MISFNVIGCCVTRDMLNPLIESGDLQVLQYNAFSSVVSMTGSHGKTEIELNPTEKYKGTPFKLRCLAADINKTVFDYVFAKRSDYIIVDILDARMSLLRNDDHFITISNTLIDNMDVLSEQYPINEYEKILPYQIDDKQWEESISILCRNILRHYSPRQVIINKFFGKEEYIDGELIKLFSDDVAENVRKYNTLCFKLYHLMEEQLKGCHVIEFPKNTIASGQHMWGLNPLHYHEIYYEYGAAAIKIIMSAVSEEEKKSRLLQIKNIYEDKFELLRKKAEINNLKNRITWSGDAAKFAQRVAFDCFGSNKMTEWILDCAKSGKRIALIKSQDIAGQIFLAALAKYRIEPIFQSRKGSFRDMSSEEKEQCRKADIIICADVHADTPVTLGDLSAIRIADIIK